MRQSQPVQQLAASPVVLVNPRAGACRRGDLVFLAAELGLGGRGFRTIGRDGSARALAAQAVRDGVPLVVAVGGDGTVHDVIQELAGTRTALSVVPFGTSNDFAKHLGLARRDGLMVRTLADGALTRVDLIRTPSAWIATAGGLGLPAQVAFRCNQLRSGRHAWWARQLGAGIYSAVAAHQICRRPLPTTRYDLESDRCSASRVGTALLVTRVARCGGLRLAHEPLAPGTFSAVLVTAATRGALLDVLVRLRLGRPLARGAVVFHGLRDLRVRTQGLVRAFGDGESLGAWHRQRFSLVAGALRVVVPRTPRAASRPERGEVG